MMWSFWLHARFGPSHEWVMAAAQMIRQWNPLDSMLVNIYNTVVKNTSKDIEDITPHVQEVSLGLTFGWES